MNLDCPKCGGDIEIDTDLHNAQMNCEDEMSITFTFIGTCGNDVLTNHAAAERYRQSGKIETGDWEYCNHEIECTVYYTESHIDVDKNEEEICQ